MWLIRPPAITCSAVIGGASVKTVPLFASWSSLRLRSTPAAVAAPFLRRPIVSALVQLACSFACWAFMSSSIARVKFPADCPDTTAVTRPATGSRALARWCAVTPTVHFSAAVTFLQSASLTSSITATAS
jgi:hypothetical protein